MLAKTRLISTVTLLCVASILCAGASQSSGKPDLKVASTQNTRTIPAYEVFEITFEHENEYADPFFDVAIDVVFTSPSKEQIKVGGFQKVFNDDAQSEENMAKVKRFIKYSVDR